MKRRLIALAGVILFALLAVAFVSPVIAAQALVRAAKAGDEAALERLVDFPAFRQSLKDELNARMVAELRGRNSDNDSALNSLGLLLAPTLVSGAVDAFVTPPAVAAMVREARTPATTMEGQPRADTPADEEKVHRSYGFRGLNTFAISLNREDRPDQRLDLLMERRGLFVWKLAAIDLTPVDPDAV